MSENRVNNQYLTKSSLIAVIFGVVALVAVYFAFTKEPEYIIDTSQKDEMVAKINDLQDSILVSRRTSDSLAKEVAESDVLVERLRSKIEGLEEGLDSITGVVADYSLKEDSTYFADKSGSPVTITRDTNIQMTPIQLKYANLNIAQNGFNKGVILTQGILITELTRSNNLKIDIIKEKDVELAAQKQISASKDTIIEEQVVDAKAAKKQAKKEKRKSFFVGVGTGVLATLAALLVIVN